MAHIQTRLPNAMEGSGLGIHHHRSPPRRQKVHRLCDMARSHHQGDPIENPAIARALVDQPGQAVSLALDLKAVHLLNQNQISTNLTAMQAKLFDQGHLMSLGLIGQMTGQGLLNLKLSHGNSGRDVQPEHNTTMLICNPTSGIFMRKLKQPLALAVELRDKLALEGLAGSSAIARAANLGQPQVYRNLFGRPKKVSRTMRDLCKYANVDAYEGTSNPSESKVLMEALATVWDGSDAHARRLAKLLFAHQQAHM